LIIAAGLPATIAAWFILLSDWGKTTTLQCARLEPQQISCALITATIWTKSQQMITPPDSLKFTAIESRIQRSGKQNIDVYQVVLVTRNKRIPFTEYDQDYTAKTKLESQINTFLQSPQTQTLTAQPQKTWSYWLTDLVLSLGICLLTLVFVAWMFHRPLGKVLNLVSARKSDRKRQPNQRITEILYDDDAKH
jgi:hypothetical protein